MYRAQKLLTLHRFAMRCVFVVSERFAMIASVPGNAPNTGAEATAALGLAQPCASDGARHDSVEGEPPILRAAAGAPCMHRRHWFFMVD